MKTLSGMHPTKRLLIDQTVALMGSKLSHQIESDEILLSSHVSKGSLYHHFEDFSHLIETAQIEIFQKNTDQGLNRIISRLRADSIPQEVFRQLINCISDRKSDRSLFEVQERIIMTADAQISPRLKIHHLAAQEQIVLTWMLFFAECSDRGWVDTELNDRSVGTMVEVLIHGRVIGDLSMELVDGARWMLLIESFIAGTYFRNVQVR